MTKPIYCHDCGAECQLLPSGWRCPWAPRHQDGAAVSADAMALVIEGRGKDKCVRVGCMTEIDPDANVDGFCRFHRREREAARNG